jgi:hypothetical protein
MLGDESRVHGLRTWGGRGMGWRMCILVVFVGRNICVFC